jgi:glycosyltransferase involved in cell wall biosynthesis
MRLLLVSNSYLTIKSHRLPLLHEAVQCGWDVHVAAPIPATHAEVEAEAVVGRAASKTHRFKFSRLSISPFDLLASVVELRELYRTVRPDLLHQVTPKIVTLGSIAARLACVPSVVNAISGLGYMFSGDGIAGRIRASCARLGYALALRHANQAVIVQNESDLAETRRWRLPVSTETQLILGSGVNLTRFREQELPSGTPVVLFPGRLLADKGVNEFVEAARLLKENGVRVRMVLCGPVDPGNPSALSKPGVDALVRAGDVEYWGARDDMPDALAEASVVCLPSYREGLSLALAEGAAAGRAIVTSDVPGCRETVVVGKNGYLVPARDSVALAHALEKTLSSQGRLREFGRASRAIAEQRFDNNHVVRAHFKLYSSLISKAAVV